MIDVLDYKKINLSILFNVYLKVEFFIKLVTFKCFTYIFLRIYTKQFLFAY